MATATEVRVRAGVGMAAVGGSGEACHGVHSDLDETGGGETAVMVQLLQRKEELETERATLFRAGYPVLLSVLELADQLTADLAQLREKFSLLAGETLPHLESVTSYEFVERNVLAPHRERTARLQQAIKEDERARQELVIAQSVRFLQSKLSLPTCLRIVSVLEQQRGFAADVPKLESLFLEARKKYITSLIETEIISRRDSLDDLKLFQALVLIMSGPVVDVVAQYKAAFSEVYSLGRFVIARVDWFLSSVEELVAGAKSTLILASYWNQLVLLNTSYMPLAASFLPLAEPAFVRRASSIAQSHALTALEQVRKKIGPEINSAARRQAAEQRQPAHSSAKDLRPPDALLAYPSLVLVANALADFFDSLRVFALPAVHGSASEVLDGLLGAFERLLAEKYDSAPAEKESLLGCFGGELRPFAKAVLDTYFSEGSSTTE